MKLGRGTVWALRRFAKPLVTGSIPATASIIFKPLYGQSLWSRGHRFQIGQHFGGWLYKMSRGAFMDGVKHKVRPPRTKTFPDDYEKNELTRLVLHHHEARTAAETQLSNMREKLIAAQRELSALKRGRT